METKRRSIRRHNAFVVVLLLAAALFSENMVTRVTSELISFEDQKNFFSYPDPNARAPPTVSYTTPPAPAHGSSDHTPTTCTTPTPHIAAPIVVPRSPPHITVPSPPFSFDPNSPPFTCTQWKKNPKLIWGVFGWWGSMGSAFGVPGDMKLVEALSNKRSDGIGELYRQGTAALLNSMAAPTKFPYTTTQVRDAFVTALASDKAAAAQAHLFELANQHH